MAVLEPVVVALMNSWLSRPQKSGRARVAGLWLLAISCLLACAGFIYLLIALNVWAGILYGPVIAALTTAACAFILAGLAALGFARLEREKPAPQGEESAIDAAQALFAAMEQATVGLDEPIANNPRTSVALASLAGYIAANKLH